MNVFEHEAAKEYRRNSFAYMWRDMIDDFNSNNPKNRFALTNASGYLFTTAACRWAVDVQLSTFDGMELIGGSVNKDLERLQYFFLTHQHGDHFDRPLITALSQLPIKWVIPDFFKRERLFETGIKEENIIFVRDGDFLSLGQLRVFVFSSSHFREGGGGCEEYGYYINTGSERLLFPGDVRIYDVKRLPSFERVDAVFSHVWYGAGKSDCMPFEPELTRFCEFTASFKPKKIYLTHLYQLDRTPDETWGFLHAHLAANRIFPLLSDVRIEIPSVGGVYNL